MGYGASQAPHGRPREALNVPTKPMPDAEVSSVVALLNQAIGSGAHACAERMPAGSDRMSGRECSPLSKQASSLDAALTNLADLTAWKAGNQHGVVDFNGLTTLLALVRQGAHGKARQRQQQQQVSSGAPGDETLVLVLWVLMNLSANDVLAPRIASEPCCIQDLCLLLPPLAAATPGRSNPCLGVFAARCLVNLTQSNPLAKVRCLGAHMINAA